MIGLPQGVSTMAWFGQQPITRPLTTFASSAAYSASVLGGFIVVLGFGLQRLIEILRDGWCFQFLADGFGDGLPDGADRFHFGVHSFIA